jgi:hypothetical protein
MSWQRTNVQAAATYLRERIGAGATDARTKSVYEGLLDVLDPTRRNARVQRELASSAKAAVSVQRPRERRGKPDRRAHSDRRRINAGPPDGQERRSGVERRQSRDRRAGR